jgi:hypothetical protein
LASAVLFCPRSDLTIDENLQGFIQSAREDLQIFGADLDFDTNVWDLTDFLDIKGRGNKRIRINFFALSNGDLPETILQEPFLSFAKAYYRYMHGLRPKKFVMGRLYALKALAQALESEAKYVSVRLVNGHVFDKAAEILRIKFSEGLAYRLGGDLEQLANFLAENNLTKVPVRWRNTLRRPSDAQRVGKEFDERRAAKLPTEAALAALPAIFRLAETPLDIIVTSITAILLSAPGRISEVLLLPENCEVIQNIQDTTTYRLRWWPSKGADPMLKPVYSGMADVVKEAISKLRRISAPAREVAAWYETNPEKIYLSAGLEHLRDKTWIALSDVSKIIGIETAWSWCTYAKIKISRISGESVVRFEDVERHVLKMLPNGFPFLNRETRTRYSEALILVRKNELHAQRGRYLCMIEPVPTDCINGALGSKNEDRASIFDRSDFKEPDGTLICVTTHQFRHFLHTIAKMGGMSELDIAKWAGRVDVRQNAAYDHVTTAQMLVQIRQAVGDSSMMFGPLGKAPDRRLISRDEFAQLIVPAAHTTEIGFCIHDYSGTPCETHRDCINCQELVCMKGDSSRNAEVRRQLEEARRLLEQAKSAMKESNYGADRWVAHQKVTVERLEQLCSILDDPSVPVGAFISLAPPPSAEAPRLGNQASLAKPTQLTLISGKP